MKKTGEQMILDERQRQLDVEGWTAGHDDCHDGQQLQRAAEAYYLSAGMTLKGFKSFRAPDCWPWGAEWWKPSTPIRDLTKAGALWLAELSRMQRLGKNFPFPTIKQNMDNRVQECGRKIDELLANGMQP